MKTTPSRAELLSTDAPDVHRDIALAEIEREEQEYLDGLSEVTGTFRVSVGSGWTPKEVEREISAWFNRKSPDSWDLLKIEVKKGRRTA